MQNGITHKPNTAQATSYYTGFGYNDLGQLTRASIADGRQRTVTFRLNADGQILRRDEADNVASTGDPHEVWYRFNGRQLGSTGNNGTNDLRNAASIAEREQVPPTGPAGAFRGGQTQSITYADFADSSDAINSYSQGSSAGGYTVRSGDTLAGIAQNLWGDAGLWYKLAQANGLSGSGGGASPAAGTVLMLPAGVVRSTYNASTLTPYNPAEAIGDLTPSTPTPQAPKKNKCGVFGQILTLIIAVAVSYVLPGIGTAIGNSIGAAIGGGVGTALGTAVGAGLQAGLVSAVSQGIGVAVGLQDKFSFRGVALAAITAGVGGTGIGNFGPIGGSKFLGNVVGGALASAATQGIAVATGLQSKFDFVGVAAAGIGAGVGGAIGRSFRAPRSGAAEFGQRLAVSAASGLANAATRSAISGTSFGDNIVAAIPDIIAQAVGGLLASEIGVRTSAHGDARKFTEEAAKRNGLVPGTPEFADFIKGNSGAIDILSDNIARARRSGNSAEFVTARDESARGLLGAIENAGQKVRNANSFNGDTVVIRAREDTSAAIKYLDSIGKYNDVLLEGYGLNLETPEHNQLFRARALVELTVENARGGFSLALDAAPLIGSVKSGIQIATGTEVFTGKPINRLVEGGALVVSFVPFGKVAGRVAAKYGPAIGRFGKVARGTEPLQLASTISGETMDAAQFSRIKSAFERNGGTILQNSEVDGYLSWRGVEAVTDNSKQILFSSNPSRSAVFEELIHTSQHRRGLFNDYVGRYGNVEAERLLEIQAAEKLIGNRGAYGISNAETRQTIARLRGLRQGGQ